MPNSIRGLWSVWSKDHEEQPVWANYAIMQSYHLGYGDAKSTDGTRSERIVICRNRHSSVVYIYGLPMQTLRIMESESSAYKIECVGFAGNLLFVLNVPATAYNAISTLRMDARAFTVPEGPRRELIVFTSIAVGAGYIPDTILDVSEPHLGIFTTRISDGERRQVVSFYVTPYPGPMLITICMVYEDAHTNLLAEVNTSVFERMKAVCIQDPQGVNFVWCDSLVSGDINGDHMPSDYNRNNHVTDEEKIDLLCMLDDNHGSLQLEEIVDWDASLNNHV